MNDMIVIDIMPAPKDRVMVAVKRRWHISTSCLLGNCDEKWFHRAPQQQTKQTKPVDFELLIFRVVGMIVRCLGCRPAV